MFYTNAHIPIQKDLDDYVSGKPMSLMLAIYLETMDEGYQIRNKEWRFKSLIEAARKNGMKVVAIDSEVSYAAGSSARDGVISSKRLQAMNYQAAQVITEHQKKSKGKYIVFVGGTHVTTFDGVSGLSEILDCPNLFIKDSCEERVLTNLDKKRISSLFKEKEAFEEFQGIYHFFLEMPS